MKTMIIGLLALVSSTAVQAAEVKITISNQSYDRVDLGSFKGIKLPSICEDGPCLEEAFQRLRPLNHEMSDIGKDPRSVTIDTDTLSKNSLFLVINNGSDENYAQFEIASCAMLGSQADFYEKVSGSITLSSDVRTNICILGDSLNITVK